MLTAVPDNLIYIIYSSLNTWLFSFLNTWLLACIVFVLRKKVWWESTCILHNVSCMPLIHTALNLAWLYLTSCFRLATQRHVRFSLPQHILHFARKQLRITSGKGTWDWMNTKWLHDASARWRKIAWEVDKVLSSDKTKKLAKSPLSLAS